MFKNIKKISTKILLPTLAILFVALAITGALSAYLSYNSTLKTLNQTMTETITAASNRVTAEINTYKTLLTEVAGSIINVEPTKVMGVLEKTRERHGFKNISITLPNGIVGGTETDVSQYEFFKIPRDKAVAYVSEPMMNEDGKSMTIYISAPILVGNRFDGIIFVGLDSQVLNGIVANISVGETGNAAIIDKTGSTIAFYDYPTVLSRYNTNKEQETDPKLSRLAALEREVMAGKSGFGSYSYDGMDKFMAYAPVANTDGWGMYVNVAQDEFMQGTYTSIMVSVVVIVVFLVLAIVILLALVRSISRPIMKVEQAAAEMAKGNFDVEIAHQSSDEIGGLANSMRQMLSTTKEIILDTSRGLTEIAGGNFNISPKVKYIGVFSGIATAMLKIITDLSNTMAQIKMSAGQVSSGSGQVSDGAQSLAQGATEQASAIEELSASIAEVTQQINRNAESAGTASGLVIKVGNDIRESSEHMDEMQDAMTKISNSSAEIGKIIKTIEDIAFQTNILALNAAVEAARAGAAGKGFAVVADEVRNLATKSSEAAKQTSQLIEGSISSVGNGVQIADATAKSLVSVVTGAQKITALIEEISLASTQQSTSISQINLGVEQISSVVQTNSATSEESAAASEELSGQATMMKELIDGFQLKN